MRVLQDALRRLLRTTGSISVDYVTESLVPFAKSIPFREFQSLPLFLWYDYFSVPQLEQNTFSTSDDGGGSKQATAINSIPAYVAKCRFFFALCPTMDCPLQGKVLNVNTWATRGWTRLERASRELSKDNTWILVQSSSAMEAVGTALSFATESVGEGAFTFQGDRVKLASVMQTIMKRKLVQALRAGDLPSYRRHLNLQSVHFRGLDAEPVTCLARSFDLSDVVADFLHQNGLTSVAKRDVAGWAPLHYAALSGNLEVIEGLLRQRADPNRRTSKDEPTLGFPLWVSALDLAVFYKHNDAARLLIASRAKRKGGLLPAMHHAAVTNNVEGVRLLCEARGDVRARNFVGLRALEVAATYGAQAAMEEVVRQGRHSEVELSVSLFGGMCLRGGTAEVVQQLVGLRANVDTAYDVRRDLSRMGRVVVAAKSLQHRLGRQTAASAVMYHCHGCTPLMAAVRSGQFEGAAALIAAGAQLDLVNSRGWTAADFAGETVDPGICAAGS